MLSQSADRAFAALCLVEHCAWDARNTGLTWYGTPSTKNWADVVRHAIDQKPPTQPTAQRHGLTMLRSGMLLESVKRTLQRLLLARKPVLLNEGDIEEMHIKGSGPGGQAVNKTNNAVCLLHRPTGIQVRSHKTRYLEINRRNARALLSEALDRHINGPASKSSIAEMQQRERKRVQARKSKKKHASQPSDKP